MLPIAGGATVMGNGDDEDEVPLYCIEHAIGEHRDKAPLNVFVEKAPPFGLFDDFTYRGADFGSETRTQPRATLSIKANCLLEFQGCFRMEDMPHLWSNR